MHKRLAAQHSLQAAQRMRFINESSGGATAVVMGYTSLAQSTEPTDDIAKHAATSHKVSPTVVDALAGGGELRDACIPGGQAGHSDSNLVSIHRCGCWT